MNNSSSLVSPTNQHSETDNPVKPRGRRGRPVGDRESKRAELLAAAIAVTAEEGYTGASLRKVAKRIGGTTGTVTYYFANKEEMITAVAEELFSKLAALLDVNDENLDLNKLLQKWLVLNDSSETDLWLVFIQLLAHARHEPAIAAVIQRHSAQFRSRLASIVETGQAQGTIRNDIPAELLADQLCALCDGWVLMMPIEPERFTPERVQVLLQTVSTLIAPPSASSV